MISSGSNLARTTPSVVIGCHEQALGQPKVKAIWSVTKISRQCGSEWSDRKGCSDEIRDKKDLGILQMDPTNPEWDSWLYRIGCPVWGCKEWGGIVYPLGTPSTEYLSWYSQHFPTVEGNSTFYAVPPVSTFEKWRDQAAPGFKFCFKFPKSISHDKQLTFCDVELKDWLHKLSILEEADHLGPTFLQLGPSFAYKSLDRLEKFLRALPNQWPWAVELRHLDWFDAGPQETRLEDLLRELQIDRVLFDSRPLNSLDPSDLTETASQVRKPKSPFRTSVTGTRPMVRLIGRNNPNEVTQYWQFWATQINDSFARFGTVCIHCLD